MSHHILYFCEFKPNAKFQNHGTTPSGEKVTQGERKKKERRREKEVERENAANSWAAHTLRSDQFQVPMFACSSAT